jgi:beta-galactosidase
MGTEIYWHGILDYSNRDNRRLAELNDIHKKTKLISGAAGSVYQAAFAVAKDYDNAWDAKQDVWHQRVEKESEAGIFQAAQLAHTPFDYVYLEHSPDAEELLKKYLVIFYPHGIILTKERAALLEEYVSLGGTLVLGCRTGYKEISGKCPMHNLPGLLQNLSGTDVVDYTFVSPADDKVLVEWDGTEFEAAVFSDILEPIGSAKIAGTYKNNYYAGKAALVYNEFGKGKVYYFGGTFNREASLIFLKKLGLAEPYADLITVPESCEIAVRKKGNTSYCFVLNYSKDAASISLKKEMKDLYSGKTISGTVELPPYGTAVFV